MSFRPQSSSAGLSAKAARPSQIEPSQSPAPTMWPGSAAQAARSAGEGCALR